MKFLAWLIGIVIGLVLLVYVVAFTSIGNAMIKPMVEGKIQAQTKMQSKLKTFSLSMSDFEIVLELNKNNVVGLKGTYSLFGQSFDVDYDVKLDELATLKPLTGVDLNKHFHTDGRVVGDMAFMKVDGKSSLALSDTSYHIELTQLNPTSIIAKIKNLKLAELLEIGAQKSYASADVNLDVNFKSIKKHALDGDILLTTKDGVINSKVMKSDFKIDIPSTKFSMNLDAKLKGDDISYDYKLLSNLFNIATSGDVVPEPLKTDIKYSVDIRELALLKPVTGADVRGAFKLNGSVKGTKEKLVVDGKSDVASSDTRFKATLKDFNPMSVDAKIKNLKLQKVLYMLKQPHYTDGVLNLDVAISDARSGKLDGTIVSSIKNGLLDSNYMTKAYKFESKMPLTHFTLNTKSILSGDMVDTKLALNSTLANLDVKKASFNVKDSSIKSDYRVKVHSLKKLFFATQRAMRGEMIASGELKKAKDLDFTMHSKVAGGKLDAKLHNDDFHADLVDVQTIDVLHMLIYPEIFKSALNAKVDYNLAKEHGKLTGALTDGHFKKNGVLTLIKKYAKLDLYKEKFAGDVSADIKKENIVASLNLTSNKSSIKTEGTKLNSKTKELNSRLDIVANHNPISVILSGKTDDLDIDLDVADLAKYQVKKAITDDLNKKDSKIKHLLNKLF